VACSTSIRRAAVSRFEQSRSSTFWRSSRGIYFPGRTPFSANMPGFSIFGSAEPLGHDKEANAIVVLMNERSKAAAMPFWGGD
jgi:hypothetical protein